VTEPTIVQPPESLRAKKHLPGSHFLRITCNILAGPMSQTVEMAQGADRWTCIEAVLDTVGSGPFGVYVMKCDQVFELLSAYADKEATSEETAIVETHVAVCADCARYLSFIRSASSIIAAIPVVDPPASLHAAILAATTQRPTWQQRFRAFIAPGLSPQSLRYGALAGSAVVAWLVMQPYAPNTLRQVPVADRMAQGNKPIALPNPTVIAAEPSLLFSDDVDFGVELIPATTRAAEKTEIAVAAQPLTIAPIVTKLGPAAPRRSPALLTIAGPADTGKAKAATQVGSFDAEVMEPGDVSPVEPGQPVGPMVAESAAGASEGAIPMAGAGGQPVVVPTTHIALASYSEPAPPTQLVTLADLKRSLRKQALDERARFINESISEKRIRLDVVRSRF